MATTPRPIVLDCDPGHDDALALLLARADPSVDLRAITTVHGNASIDAVTRNALRMCTIAGITDVPVARGAATPLVRPLQVAVDIHGESGLDGPSFGEPTVTEADMDAVSLMHQVIGTSDQPVTLIPTGALTNIAHLLQIHPGDASLIREIVWMGGSTVFGNITPYAEANAAKDPEAADLVVRSGVPFTLVGLNVTHQALVTPDIVERMRTIGTPLAGVCVDLMTFFTDSYRQTFGMPDPPLHDPVAVARVIDPTLVRCVEANLVVETEGRWTSGATVVDLHHYSGRPANASIAVELDVDRFWDLMISAVASFR